MGLGCSTGRCRRSTRPGGGTPLPARGVDCGETNVDENSRADWEPDLCAEKALLEKKAFRVTRKLAVSGQANASIETIVGHSDGQVFRILYRSISCDYGSGAGPMSGDSV